MDHAAMDLVFRHITSAVANDAVLFQNAGGQTITYYEATTAATRYIVSSDAADAAAGTGMRTIRIYSTSIDGWPQYEDLPLDGTTAVALDPDTQGFIYLDGLTYGSGGKAAGHITIQNAATSASAYYAAIDDDGHSGFPGKFKMPSVPFSGRVSLKAYSVIATTATDSFYVSLREDGVEILRIAAFAPGEHTRATDTIELAADLKPGGVYQLDATKIGTTNQTVSASLNLTFGA